MNGIINKRARCLFIFKHKPKVKAKTNAKTKKGGAMEILTEQKLSERLGLSIWTIRRFRKYEGLPYFKIGSRIFYNFEAVNEWFAGCFADSDKTDDFSMPLIS